MRSRKADGYNHVACFLLLRSNSAIGDSVRTSSKVTLHIALVLHHSVYHIASTVVRIHCVGTPGNRVVNGLCLQAVILRHNHASQHTPCLTYIKLRGEVLVILIFIQRIAPLQKLSLNAGRYTLVCPQNIEQALGIVLVQLSYGVALLVGSFWVIPTIAYHIRRETTLVIVISLQGVPTVGTRGILHVSPFDAVAVSAPALLLHPTEEQFVFAGVVIIRHLIRNSAEGRVLG